MDGDAVAGQGVDQAEHLVQGLEQGRDIGQLRADMAVDALDGERGQGGGAAVQGKRLVEGHAELVFLETRGDVGVGARIDVRVHAQRDRRGLAEASGNCRDPFQFRRRLDVETGDTLRQREFDFGCRLAHAGENHLARAAAGGQYALEFAAGDDVETGAQPGEGGKDGQVGIGLHGVADQRVAARKAGGEFVPGVGQRALGINIAGRAIFVGDARQGDALGVQFAVADGEEFGSAHERF